MGTDDRNTAQWRCTSLFASTETCTPQHREGGRIDDQRMGTRSEHPTQAMGTRSASEAQWVHSTSQHPFWLLMYRDFLRESLTCVEGGLEMSNGAKTTRVESACRHRPVLELKPVGKQSNSRTTAISQNAPVPGFDLDVDVGVDVGHLDAILPTPWSLSTSSQTLARVFLSPTIQAGEKRDSRFVYILPSTKIRPFFLFGRRLLCRAGARSAEKFWM